LERQIVRKEFRIIDPEIGVRKIAAIQIKGIWPKNWTIPKIKYKEKWERLVK
jgi:hypothetical protein